MKEVLGYLWGAGLVLVVAVHAPAIEIVFDYSLDTNNFFDTQAKRDVLEAAATQFELFTDRLDAIVPGGLNNQGTPSEFADSWTAFLVHPGTGELLYQVHDLTIPEDTVRVFVGGFGMDVYTLGMGASGSSYSSGGYGFNTAVRTRGQTGVDAWTPDDIGPWGGSIMFNTRLDWNLGPSPFSLPDLFSVAVHELGHVLGFARAESFKRLRSGLLFTGQKATQIYGANPPLHFDQVHWASGVHSYTPDGQWQEAAMEPTLSDGDYKPLTRLDYAAFEDIGWQVPASMYGGLDGDLNGDGFVGVDDLNIVLAAWNQTVESGDYGQGDPSGDGFVGVDDLNMVLLDWNAGTPLGGVVDVPEPATLLMLLAGVGFIRGRA